MPDDEPPDKQSVSVMEQSSEFLGIEADQVVDEPKQFISSSASTTAAMGHEPVKFSDSVVEFSKVSVSKTDSALIESDAKQHQITSASFITECASEMERKQIAACPEDEEVVFARASISSSVPAAVMQIAACPEDEEVVFTCTSISSSVPAAVNHLDSYVSRLEKSSNEEAQHFSRSAEETLKVDDAPVSVAGPINFGASAIERLFAAKESDDVYTSYLALVDNASVAVSNVEHVQTVEADEMRDLQCEARPAFTDTSVSGLSTSVSCEPMVNSLTEAEARKQRKSVMQNIAQPADDLLTRVKLANSMPYQTMPSTHAHHSFRLVHSAAKQNSASAFKAVNRSLPLSSLRHLYTSSAFQQYEPALGKTKELARDVDFSRSSYPQLGISGDSSRMDISGQHMELTDTLPTNLVSFSLTENLDATKQEEAHQMHLRPIRNLKSLSPEPQSTGTWVGDGQSNVETSVAGNVDTMELSLSVKSSSQPGGGFSLPPMAAASESSAACLPSVNVTVTDSVVNNHSDEHSQLEVMKSVKKLSLASPAASSCGHRTDICVETSVARGFLDVPPVVVAVKSSSESCETWSLPTTDVSQSSVFCSAESDTSRTDYTHVTPRVVGPVSVPNSQVPVKSNIFCQFCRM